MRLSPQEHESIVQAVHLADPVAEIYLHGSRADYHAKGGDIDIMLLSRKIKLMNKLDILVSLRKKLGDRKIDVSVFPDASQAFAQIAIATGVRLN